jgi:glycosyltransferase involved in cell wall biosynthesis
MQLGFVLYGDLSTRTGGFLYDRMLVQGLKDLGAQVEIIQLPWRCYPISFLLAPSTEDIENISSGKYDVLIEDELAHPSLIRTNRIIRRLSATPIISLVHHLRSSELHPAALHRIYRRVEETYLSTIDGVITNSPQTLSSVESLLERELPSIVAPPGRGHYEMFITEQEIEERAFQEGPINILFLGSIIPRKRLDVLIEALSSVAHIDFTLTVIGSDTTDQRYTGAMKKLIKSRSLEQQVHWLGEQPDERVKQALQASHLLVVPSSLEGFGIAYLDAMGYGVIPIGTRCGGAASLITHSQNGFLIDPGDIEELASYIEVLTKDHELRCQLARSALRRYQQQPTWKEVAGTVYDYLKALINNPDEVHLEE